MEPSSCRRRHAGRVRGRISAIPGRHGDGALPVDAKKCRKLSGIEKLHSRPLSDTHRPSVFRRNTCRLRQAYAALAAGNDGDLVLQSVGWRFLNQEGNFGSHADGICVTPASNDQTAFAEDGDFGDNTASSCCRRIRRILGIASWYRILALIPAASFRFGKHSRIPLPCPKSSTP